MSTTDTTAAADLASMKLPELRKLAAERGLKGISGLRKGELIEALTTGTAPKRAKAAKAADAPATSAPKRNVLGGDSPRRVPRKAASESASVSAAVENAAEQEPQEQGNQGEKQDGGDNRTYESRSQARRARRNRARREARNEQGQNGAQDDDSKKSLRERSRVGDDEAAQDSSADSNAGDNAERSSEDQHNHDEQRGRGERGNRRGRHGDRNNDRGNDRTNDRGEKNDNDGQNDKNGRNRHNNDDGGNGRRGRRGRRNRRNRGGNDGQGGNNHGGNGDLQVREGDELQAVGGILEVVDNNVAFLRTTGYHAAGSDVFVNNNLVRRLGLRSGDAVTGQVKVGAGTKTLGNGRNRRKYNQLVQVDSVNGLDPQTAKDRPEFSKLTPLYPNQRLRLETDPKILTTRVIDLIMPIGKGQRALIVSPPKAGKTTILQNIANAISTNNPECYLMVVLVDERPEEVTDMQRSVKGEVIASTFDRPPSEHTAVAELAIERAKRLVEQGKDVVVLLDSITRLGRAYNNSSPASGRILSGGVDSNALYPPKRFLGAARNIENGGSLTIIATAMVETGSTGDTVIFEEFKGTGNAELKLDRAISERRIFPAVDVNPSGTRKDELLLVPEEARIMTKLRRILSGLDSFAAIDLLIKQLKKTKSNGEFLMQIASSAPMVADKDVEDYV
ncbi:transcription termination factor Rho [Corynebacterium sp. HMSC077D10]|uniref:transcription termination factor Rho n=1 Tax=unclassified Corynebacterium TaxID=2624378 RepID=UPI0008A3F206|nr:MULTISPECIES: transcription termination factor Rho [unclassified Corynebacterium]OFP19819.1 transcription termination factor Rho [Corynebacterium sp. HMSC065A05]OFP64956.1 transcription termination factor Rho [Corynebacterium sp. HMSC077D10]